MTDIEQPDPESMTDAWFAKLGEAEVRARLIGQWSNDGVTALHARLWLATIEAGRERDRIARAARERGEEMALLERSMRAAEGTAKYTRAAAFASAVAAIAALITAIWSK